MYGSQHPPPPPSGSQFNTQQPEWQSNTSAFPPPPPPPPPPPGSASYTPSTYGPMPGTQLQIPSHSPSTSPALATQFDTTSWGVRYNRQQQHHHSPSGPPPPLPPRTSHQSPPPPSYTPPATSAPPGASWSAPPPPPPPRPGQHAQPWAQPPSYNQAGQAGQVEHPPPPPPPRPPVPPAYQQESQQAALAWQQTPTSQSIPGPYYATGPPTHRYDPPQPQHRPESPDLYSPSSPTTTTSQSQAAPPSSHAELPASFPSTTNSEAPQSILTTSAQGVSYTTSASALGAGGPSDWEHFSPVPVTEDGHSSQKHENSASTPQITQSPIVQSPQTMTLPVQTQEPPSVTAPSTPPSTDPPPQPSMVASPPRVENSPQSHQNATRPAPGQDDSLQSNSSIVSTQGYSEEIDKVISAWNQPISPKSKPKEDAGRRSPTPEAEKGPSPPSDEPPAKPSPSSTEDAVASAPSTAETQKEHPQSQTSATADVPTKEPEPAKLEVKYLDPYEDLDPWFKSSLERYVTMLRKEAVADSDEEKYKIFTNFVAKEAKLREVLYNIEPEEKKKKPEPPATPSPAPGETKSASPTPAVDSGLIPVGSEESRTPVEDAPYSPAAGSTEDGEDIAYSPGGRPILSRRPAAKKSPPTQRPHRSASNPGDRPANGLQGLLHGVTFASDPTARPVSVPPPTTHKPFTPQPTQPLISEPPQPAYTPFRYSEGPQRNADVLNEQRPAYQAYSALRQASAGSGRAMANPASPASQGPQGDFAAPIDETFLGIIREKSVSYRGKHPALLPGAGIEALGALIPNPFPKPEMSSEIVTVQKEMEKFSEDFSYIREAVDKWEESAKERRANMEKQRLEREQASEERIDGLFNDKEIGYADINKLEDEFRQSEARTQLEEERKELDNFIRQVFNPLDTRIREEIVELRALLQRAMDDLIGTARSSNGHATLKRYQVSHTMKVILALAEKLENRFQHRLDIALDRERRRKKAERRPFVYLGDSRALKTLDGDFEKMEKQNVVDAAKDRDHRANQLTDLFDEAILFALGGHQRLVDDILGKAKRLDGKAIERSSLSDDDKELVLRSISALVKGLVDDAESMLTSVKVADTMLNDADYSVSVAQARFSNATEDVYERLAEEKKKEDAKIEADFEAKMDSFKDGPAQITAKMDTLLKVMGKAPGPGTGPWRRPAAIAVEDPVPSIPAIETEYHPAEVLMPGPRPTSASVAAASDPEQQERLRKALEEAKRRNAAKGLTA